MWHGFFTNFSYCVDLQVDNLLKYVGDEMVEIQQKFKEYLVKEKIKLSLELDIKLLYGSWSILSKGVRLNYPPQVRIRPISYLDCFHSNY